MNESLPRQRTGLWLKAGTWALAFSAAVVSIGFVPDALALRLPDNYKVAPEVRNLSQRLLRLQRALKRDLGIDGLSIGGGSARDLLDAVYLGKPLAMRDLDLVAVAGHALAPQEVQRVGQVLKSAMKDVGDVSPVESRRRGNPFLPEPQRYQYNAGFGIFLNAKDGLIYDLSLFHGPRALNLNGALNIDTIRIPLRRGRSLEQQIQHWRGRSYSDVVRHGLVVDAHGGYGGWQRHDLRVAHATEVASKPVLWTIRLARSFGKAGYRRLPVEVLKLLRKSDQKNSGRPAPQLIARYVARLLADKDSAREWAMVKQAGVLQSHASARAVLGKPNEWTLQRVAARVLGNVSQVGRPMRAASAVKQAISSRAAREQRR